MNIQSEISTHSVILFDLGGVIINLKYEDTISAMQDLGAPDFHQKYTQALQTGLFDDYETGKISSMHFINKLKEMLPNNVSPNKVVSAWNAMIKDFPIEKLNYLLELKKTHTVALLSNTNDLHEACVRRRLKEVSDLPLEDYFHYTFLSHNIKMRKPHEETFQWVCNQMNIDQPQTVLFLDDSSQHLEGAKKAGLSTLLFHQNDSFM